MLTVQDTTFAEDAWQKSLLNTWVPNEINMHQDVVQWRGQELTAGERRIVERSLGFFATADSLVANNIVLATADRFEQYPSIHRYLIRQAYEESLHTMSYQHCIESLSMDEGAIYNMYNEIPSVAEKAEWAIKHTAALERSDRDQDVLDNLVSYYAVVEGVYFYAGFAQVLSLGRRNLMSGTSEQFQYILRDESLHLHFGIDLIKAIIKERPDLWGTEAQVRAQDRIKEGTELEIAFAQDTMPQPILGMNAQSTVEYLEYIANRRCRQLGLEHLYEDRDISPFPWMAEMIDMRKEKNFFERRVVDYQIGGQLKH